MAEGPVASGVRMIPPWLQYIVLVVAVSTFLSGWATTLLVWQDVEDTDQRVTRITFETRALGLCLIEQFAEHRDDNRTSHDALSDAHGIGLPPPPAALPEPREEVEQALIKACEPYLDLRSERGRP